jgi:hypothetical protein
MKAPCELIGWYLLPSVRAELARELLKSGLSQKEVSEKLGMTQPAISYYLRRKRGNEIKFNKQTNNEIRKLAKSIARGCNTSDQVLKICQICMEIRRGRALCELHMKHDSVPEKCNVCTRL